MQTTFSPKLSVKRPIDKLHFDPQIEIGRGYLQSALE